MGTKIVKGGVRCEYWNQSRHFELEFDDDTTEEEIEEAMRLQAIEVSGFEWWIED